MVEAAYICECTKNFLFKWVTYIVGEFYLNKSVVFLKQVLE